VVGKSAYYLRKKESFHIRKDPISAVILGKDMGEDGTMSEEQIKAFVAEYRAKRISPEDRSLWKRAPSNQAHHYFGSAQMMGQIGKAFADAIVELEK